MPKICVIDSQKSLDCTHHFNNMKKRSKKKKHLQIQRELAIAAGYYDGRFATKVTIDKKKSERKRKCRKFRLDDDIV